MRRTAPHRLRSKVAAAFVAVVAIALVAPVPSAVGTAKAADRATAQKKPVAELQTFGIGPANKDGLDRRGAFVFAGRPGTVVEDQFALVNYTTEPRTVRVYASDAFTTDAGVYDVLAADKVSKDLGSWVDLKPRTVTIPARKSRTSVKPGTLLVPFTVTVPADATPGDHAAGFVASVRTDAAATSSVVVDRRVGTRMYMQVQGALKPHLAVTDLKATYSGTLNPIGKGVTKVSYVVENTGNVVLSTRQSTRVDTWFSNATPATAQADLIQLLPGARVNVSVTVPGTWPTVRPEAIVTLVPFTGTPAAARDLPPVSASTSFWAVPWPLIVLLGLVVLLVLAGLNARDLRRRRSAGRPDVDVPNLVGAP